MKDALKRIFLSTSTMGALMLVFGLSIGIATFIENSDSTHAARLIVYETWWFEAVIFILCINLIYNVYRYSLFKLAKLPMLMFHLSFIVIIIGAAITRYVSEEGGIKIGEGETLDFMYSADPYVGIKASDENGILPPVHGRMLFSQSTDNYFEHDVKFPDKTVHLEMERFLYNIKDTVRKSDKGGTVLQITIAGAGTNGRQAIYLRDGEMQRFGENFISFNNSSLSSAIQFSSKRDELFLYSPYTASYADMSKLTKEDRQKGMQNIPQDTIYGDSLMNIGFQKLLNIEGMSIVPNNIHLGSQIEIIESDKEDLPEAMVINATCENEKKQLIVKTYSNQPIGYSALKIAGKEILMGYGKIAKRVPFKIKLRDIRNEFYPGSSQPSSFESDITLFNEKGLDSSEHMVFMNSVVVHKGYRIFQSGYEKGDDGMEYSTFAVNHDWWGTWTTYVGYFFMALGFILNLFWKGTRYSQLTELIKKARKQKAALSIAVLTIFSVFITNAQDLPEYSPIPKEHSDKVGKICVQDMKGRIKPFQTLASEVLRKLSKKDNIDSHDATQAFLGMTFRADYWSKVPVVRIYHQGINEKIKISGKYAAFSDFFEIKEREVQKGDSTVVEAYREMLLEKDYEKAFSIEESKRNKYQKEVLKTFDKIIMMEAIFYKEYARIFPIVGDKNNTWASGAELKWAKSKTAIDSLTTLQLLTAYEKVIFDGFRTKDYSQANNFIAQIDEYQRGYANDIMPSKSQVEWEISYNNSHVLDFIWIFYFCIGMLLLFVELPSIIIGFSTKWFAKIVLVITILLALWHAYALAVRWYASGHAPWSNGYEALVFIGLMTVVAGIAFSKGTKLTIGAATLLAGALLMTAHHSNYDPDITNLVPVLKSYWLVIHVAIMTSSYSFLGVGSLMGLLNLLLFIFRSQSNKKRVNLSINEMSYLIEKVLTVGVFMATVGTFLGGIWANESWGRYWGWDAKETWALVIVLWYAMLLHFRMIPGMKGKLLFNAFSMWSFWTVLMTFFGVNYYLTKGLHSYGRGEAPPFPTWAIITIVLLALLTVVAIMRNRQYKKNNEKLKSVPVIDAVD